MEVLFGLGVAASLGIADFVGGSAGRRTGPLPVITGIQFVGAAVIGIYLLAAWQPLPSARETVLAAIAGAALSLGAASMYTGLSWGRMSVMAPVTAAAVAVATFGVGLVRGERPSALALAGVALAIVAVVLIARPPQPVHVSAGTPEAARRIGLVAELALSIAAGASFAAFQAMIGEIGSDAGVAPLLLVRGVGGTLSLLALLVLWYRSGTPPLRAPRRSTLLAVLASGVLLVTAHALLIEALALGLLSIVGPITSLSPAFTVIPARIFLNEHISGVQVVGIVLATVGLVLVALG